MIINFLGNLKDLLRPPFRGRKKVEYALPGISIIAKAYRS